MYACTFVYTRTYARGAGLCAGAATHFTTQDRSPTWYKKHTKNTQKTHKVINSHVYITHTHTVLLLILLLMIDLIPGTKVQTLLSYLVQKLLIGYATPKHAKRSTNTSDRSSVWAHTRS